MGEIYCLTDSPLKSYILEHFHYNNGVITRDDRKNSNGCVDRDGYLRLKIKGKRFLAHRIVWLLCTGEFPQGELDHINRCRTDNRIENLRLSNRQEQANNSVKYVSPETHIPNIYKDHTRGLKKNIATKVNGKTYRFYTIDEAIAFRKEQGVN